MKRLVRVIFSVVLPVLLPTLAAADQFELLISPKTGSAAHMLSKKMEVGKVYRKKFKSKAAQEEFCKKLASEDFDCEKSIQFSADNFSADNSASKKDNPAYRKTVPATSDADAPPSVEGVPLSGNEWSLFPNTQDPNHSGSGDIDLTRAWSITKGSDHIYVFVMDSGISDDNVDLQGLKYAGFDSLQPDQAPSDGSGHGTQVTSIFAAKGIKMIGIAPGTKFVDGRFLDANNQGDTEHALAVLDFFEQKMVEIRDVDKDAKFIGNNSWGSNSVSQLVLNKMKRLSAYDYLPITSAGNTAANNDLQPYFPCNADIPGNICVAASDASDKLADFSGFGPTSVALMAPGVDIFGIVPGGGYERKSGTSQAVPHVTGVAALIWTANPQLTALQVHDVLINSVDSVPSAQNAIVSGGRLNAYRALLVATDKDTSAAQRADSSNSVTLSDGGCALSDRSSQPGFWAIVLALGLALSLLALRRTHFYKSE